MKNSRMEEREMSDKKFDKQKLLTLAVVTVLIIFFVGGFWIGLDRVRSMEGTFPPNDIKEGISPAPENASDAADYLVEVLNHAVNSNPSVSYDSYFSVDSDSLQTDGSETFKSTLLFALDNFEDHISSAEESDEMISSVNFGDDITSVLKIFDKEVRKPIDFNCNYIYYSCPSCGETSDEQLSSCEPCGSERQYFKKYRNEYEIELVLKEDPAPGAVFNDNAENFVPRNESEILSLTDSVFNDALQIDNIEIEYNKYKVFYKVNRLTDEITTLRYIKEMTVSADVTFIGDYEMLGQKTVSFDITETDKYDFVWPSLSLNEEKLIIEPKNTDNLLATLTCEKPLDMTVSWSSSDESIAAVDSEGYIQTTKNTGEAVITASFEYLGKTYSDTCTVYVRVPVESMKMNKKSADISVGETIELAAKVSPSNATVKTVTWYSEDEAIATVDKNGLVTGVNKGKVIVYALSDDGYYRSTCEVTVE